MLQRGFVAWEGGASRSTEAVARAPCDALSQSLPRALTVYFSASACRWRLCLPSGPDQPGAHLSGRMRGPRDPQTGKEHGDPVPRPIPFR